MKRRVARRQPRVEAKVVAASAPRPLVSETRLAEWAFRLGVLAVVWGSTVAAWQLLAR